MTWADQAVELERSGTRGYYVAAVLYQEQHADGMSEELIAKEVTAAGFPINRRTVNRRLEALEGLAVTSEPSTSDLEAFATAYFGANARRSPPRQVVDPDMPATAAWELIECSCADLPNGLDRGTVDVIVTDPPYPREYLPCYEDLSRTAARLLKPGGLLVTLAGQSYLPEVFEALATSLSYYWTAAYMTPGDSTHLWQRNVNTFWKPVLIFANGEYTGPTFGDVARSEENVSGALHERGQSLSGMADLVQRFSAEGDFVVDPFVGSGTIGFAASRTGRPFLGADIDAEALQVAKDRLA